MRRTVFAIFAKTALSACERVTTSFLARGGHMTRTDASRHSELTSAIGVVDVAARTSVNDALSALGISVTIEAEDVTSLLSTVVARPPMVAVVGSQLPGGGGMHAVHRLSKEAPSCLV